MNVVSPLFRTFFPLTIQARGYTASTTNVRRLQIHPVLGISSDLDSRLPSCVIYYTAKSVLYICCARHSALETACQPLFLTYSQHPPLYTHRMYPTAHAITNCASRSTSSSGTNLQVLVRPVQGLATCAATTVYALLRRPEQRKDGILHRARDFRSVFV